MQRSLISLLACLSLIALFDRESACYGQESPRSRPFPDTSAKIRVFADQLPAQVTDEQRRFIATHYAGSQKQTRSWIRKIRQINPAYLLLHYQLAVGIGVPLFLNGDEWVNDFDEVTKHTEWFVLNAREERLLQTAWNWYVMDIRFKGETPATGFPDYWVNSCLMRMRNSEADGCFADSYTQDILMNQTRPSHPMFSSALICKTDWLPHLNKYGAYVTSALHRQPERFVFLPNLGGLVSTWDKVTEFGVGDGGMNEGFCAPEPGVFYSDDDWKLQMTRLLQLSSKGKIILCQTSVNPSLENHRWFIVGSYLLIRGRRAYLNMMQKSALEWYPEYDIDLGAYKDEPVANLDTFWRPEWKCYVREYARGIVIVNPGSEEVAITLKNSMRMLTAIGGGMVSEDGKTSGNLSASSLNKVVIPGHSARVLLQ